MPRRKKQETKNDSLISGDLRAVKDRCVDAALSLSLSIGWADVTMADIAQESGIPLPDLCALFDDRSDILMALGRRIDQKTLAAVGTLSPEEPARDRLFDVLMTRFDVLSEEREALVALLHALKREPVDAVISLPHLGKSMMWMAEAAGLSTRGARGCVLLAALTGVYLATLYVWMDDDSQDLSKTMAALDRNLSYADQAISLVGGHL